MKLIIVFLLLLPFGSHNLQASEFVPSQVSESDLQGKTVIRAMLEGEEGNDGLDEDSKPMSFTFALVPQRFNQMHAQLGDSHACVFYSQMTSLLMSDKGCNFLRTLFVGQDKQFIYVQFPAHQLRTHLKPLYDYYVPFIEKYEKMIFGVAKNIHNRYPPLAKIENAPDWFFYLLSAYYLWTKEDYEKGMFPLDEDEEPRSNVALLRREFSFCQNSLLTGKSSSFFKFFEQGQKPRAIDLIGKIVAVDDISHTIGCSFDDEQGIRFFDSLNVQAGIVRAQFFNPHLTHEAIRAYLLGISALIDRLQGFHNTHAKGQEFSEGDYGALLSEFTHSRQECLKSTPPAPCVKLTTLSQEEFFDRLYAECITRGFVGMVMIDF